MEALKRMLGPPGRLAQWFEAGCHQSGLNLCTISNLQLSSRSVGLIPDQCQAGTRSGALDAQVQVAQCLLQSGGVRRLRVRDQAKALHRAPDHSRKQHDLSGPGFIVPDLSQQWVMSLCCTRSFDI